MKSTILFLSFLICNSALAGATRSVDADSFLSSDHTRAYSLPSGADTLVGRASSDILTNKTISGASNTLSNIARSSISTGTAYGAVVNDSSGALSNVAPGTSGNVLTSNGTSWTSAAASGSITATQEAATGTINGSNTSFSITYTPIANSVNVYLDGLYLTPTTDYSISNTTITMVTAPAYGQSLRVSYHR